MASRYRWMVLLGPPVVVAAVAAAALRPVPPALAGAPATPGVMTDCPPAGSLGRSTAATTAGTWWTQEPKLDEFGTLTGWTLVLGAPQGEAVAMALPPASIVTGPTDGMVVVATDDETASDIGVITVAEGCARHVPVRDAIVRRAILDPGIEGIIAHLIDRETRRDLGIWRLPLDGGKRVALLPPVTDGELGFAGIERVWATDLRLSGNGTLLAVQSCDPDACMTRVLDLRTRRVTTLDQGQGPVVGFAGGFLITESACPGRPCDVLSWDLATRQPTVVATGTVGACTSGDGRLFVALMAADGSTSMAAVDPRTGRSRSLGPIESGAIPQRGAGTAGIETPPGSVGLVRADGLPAIFAVDPPVDSNLEVEP